jgi:hypothetical protein
MQLLIASPAPTPATAPCAGRSGRAPRAGRARRGGLAQQRFGRRFVWWRLRATAGGIEERQVVGEPRPRAALLAPFEHPQHLLGARRDGLRQAGELGDVDAGRAVGGAGADLVQKDDLASPSFAERAEYDEPFPGAAEWQGAAARPSTGAPCRADWVMAEIENLAPASAKWCPAGLAAGVRGTHLAIMAPRSKLILRAKMGAAQPSCR